YSVILCYFSHHISHSLVYTLSLHDALPIFQADGCDCADDAGHLRSADSGVLHVAHDLAQRSSAPLHWRITDDGVFDSHLAEPDRSEEHTSELQSRSDLVCRLLLEKKKYYN